MCVVMRAGPVPQSSAGELAGTLYVSVYPEGDSCVVHVTGELDLGNRNQVFVLSTVGRHQNVVVDLSGVTFMDCSGYGGVVASRLVVEGAGRTLVIRGQTGQPARLLDVIARLESVKSTSDRQVVPVPGLNATTVG